MSALIRALSEFADWIWEVIVSVAQWFLDLLNSVYEFVLEKAFGLVIWFAELVPVPSFLSAGSVQSAFSSIPSSVWWALDATRADVGIPLVLGAYVARFLLRRIPVIG